ncbi:MAG: Ig-like domain-containing protein [Salinivirgaceae bacterium]|jgi:hypothetical protein|nr:Ig-like domain-containing protein [Salinivirgaceae bacterium]
MRYFDKINTKYIGVLLFIAVAIFTTSTNSFAQDVHKFDFNNLSTGQYDEDAVKEGLDVKFCNGADEGRVYISSASGHGNVLDVKYPKGGVKTANSGMHTKVTFQDGQEHDELYMSYSIYFPANFEFRAGGKLPGLAYQTEDRNMSLRLMWRYNGLVEYYVHYNTEPSREDFKASINWSLINPNDEPDGQPQPDQVKFKKGAWNHVELYYKLNTPGQNDGIMRGWLDGKLAIDITDHGDYRQPGEGDIKMNIIYLSTFFGGTDETFQPQKDEYAYFDDIIVSTSRIGYPGGGDVDQSTITVESVDAEQDPNVGENLFDGNPDDASRWSANGFPKSVVIDYGETKSITGTKVWTYQDRSYHYTIGISDSPSSGFTTVVDQSGTAADQPIEHSFTATSGRYLELTVTGATGYTGDWVSFTELEIVEGEATTVPVTAVSLSPSSVSLLVGETQSLSVTVSPSDATNQTVSYSSNNTAVATVNSSGLITAVSAGSTTISVTTADGNKTDNCAVTVTSDGGNDDCNFAPMTSALPTINTSYSNIFVSDNGPDLGNIRKFSINWSLENNGLYTFAFNTDNGVPNWYVSMLGAVTHTLNSSQPEISISGSVFSGFDGDYYAIMDGDNFVLAEKTGAYTIYFSTSATSPCDGLKNGMVSVTRDIANEISLYPNSSSDSYVTISGLSEAPVQVMVFDMLGKTMFTTKANKNQNTIDVRSLKTGSYILIINGENQRTSKLFNKL